LSKTIPHVFLENHRLPKIVLGHDPFIGFTSLYPNPNNKRQVYQTRFSKIESIHDVLLNAVRCGIDVVSFGINEPKEVIVAEERVQKLGLKRFPVIYQIPLKISGQSVPVRRINATLLKNKESLKQQEPYKEYISTLEFKRQENSMSLTVQEQSNLLLDTKKTEGVA
jgi:hypothetical protein